MVWVVVSVVSVVPVVSVFLYKEKAKTVPCFMEQAVREKKLEKKALEGIKKAQKHLKRKRNSRLTTSSDILHSMLKSKSSDALLQQFRYYYLWRNWSNLVHDFIASHSLPVDYRDGVLFLWVSNATWMQELSLMREEMLNCIHKKLGSPWLRSIRFTMQKKIPLPVEDKKLCLLVDSFLDKFKISGNKL